ncbi:MAG TPA: DegT/DnrJ/EryC1/StrS family aminotransferase [Coriobacteriia bacterium]|nr:DegT/DnrJ/EryC1/StrS family aminotransferase [Coriobacteriia bacterium]
MGATDVRTMTVPFVDIARMHDPLAGGLHEAFSRVMNHGGFTLGQEVEKFEREFADYVGVSHAVGVSTGTDALHLALRALGIGVGDEVITAVNTFAATAEAILMAGARPVFVDIDPQTYLMDLAAVESAITERTRAIIPVHLYGQSVNMRQLNRIAERHDLKIVEDACQAHGAQRYGLAAGAGGDAGCFSFYPSKNLGAIGDGGMVVTDDADTAERIRLLRCHGEDGQRLHVEPGYCARLHSLQAAFLRTKLPLLDEWNQSRAEAAAAYGRAISPGSVTLPSIADGADHVFHLYVVRAPDREQFRSRLADKGVQTAIHYALPLHLEPAFAALGYGPGDFPHAEKATSEIVSLPMFPYLTEREIEYVATSVEEAADA